MSLQQWLANGWVVPHKSSPAEIADLFELADRDLADCQVARLSDDWKFSIAYNAALQLATAALHASGFRPARGQSHHLRVFQSLEYTIGLERQLVDELELYRVKRHSGTYDRAGAVSTADVNAIFHLARLLREAVLIWLHKTHRELLP